MPLPSFFRSDNPARPWRVSHAGAYGALLGALAALLKTLGLAAQNGETSLTNHILEIALASLCFAVLCIAAAMARNFIARHLV